jgi:hypothetical protein
MALACGSQLPKSTALGALAYRMNLATVVDLVAFRATRRDTVQATGSAPRDVPSTALRRAVYPIGMVVRL